MYKSILFSILFSFVALISFGQFNGAPTGSDACDGSNLVFSTTYNATGIHPATPIFEWTIGVESVTVGTGTTPDGISYTATSTLNTALVSFNFYIYDVVITLNSPAVASYTVGVAETTGTAHTSGTATLDINSNPIFLTPTASITTCVGQNADFTATISGGTPDYNYTWTKNSAGVEATFSSPGTTSGTSIAGTVSSVSIDDNNSGIKLVITDDNGCSLTHPYGTTKLYVDAAPTITAQPDATAVFCDGSDVTISVAADNALTYSWHDGSSEVGTSTSYIANTVGTYTVTVGNTGCSAGTGAVVATSSVVSASPTLAITTQPTSPGIAEGESGSTSVSYTSGTGETVTWFLSGEPLVHSVNTSAGTGISITNGVGTSTINFTSVAAGDEGKAVSVTIADDCGFVNSSPAVLPVEFTYVRAGVLNNSVKVEWETASELNNEVFFIERSVDGLTFTEIGNQQGAGTSLEVIQYSFIDVAPIAGVNYYRIRQVDFDGTMEYSAVVKAEVAKSSFVVSINPTASSSQVQIILGETYKQDLNVAVYDALGRTIMNSAINAGNNLLPIDISNFTNGQYFVRLFNETETITKTFFKL
ncbi:MAG: hypothetical protein ACJAUH_001616 [Saprospiraceae bacterium]|jgi:hypothetical protein